MENDQYTPENIRERYVRFTIADNEVMRYNELRSNHLEWLRKLPYHDMATHLGKLRTVRLICSLLNVSVKEAARIYDDNIAQQ